MKRPRLDVNLGELDQLLDQAVAAPISEADSGKIKQALHAMAELLEARRRSTEKTSQVLPKPPAAVATPPEEAEAETPSGHGRNPASAYTGAQRKKIGHPELTHSAPCPECLVGKVYTQKEPRALVRIIGQAPIAAAVYELERLRCNACGQVFTAPAPEGVGPDKFDDSALAMIALLKYGTGMPWKRLEQLEHTLGVPLPATTQWELLAETAELLRPARDELIRQAAQGEVLHNDDTSMRVLNLTRPDGDERTGVFTTGVVALAGAQRIALFFTGRQHAGENIADVLRGRAASRPAPILMCDALSRNVPKGVDWLVANCLVHGRRNFVEVAEKFPEECQFVLERLGEVYAVEAEAREQKLTPAARLALHQEKSAPVMAKLEQWCRHQLDAKLVEPNSSLGGAIHYLLNHWKKLTLFLRQAGAPLDNNICERALKRVVLHRKNALFYKTLHGAEVGDLFMSLIHTCALNEVNPFEYMVALLGSPLEVKAQPARWLPWNYRDNP
jgi:transposase